MGQGAPHLIAWVTYLYASILPLSQPPAVSHAQPTVTTTRYMMPGSCMPRVGRVDIRTCPVAWLSTRLGPHVGQPTGSAARAADLTDVTILLR